RQLSHDRNCLCLASAPRHLVFSPALPNQLVATDLRTGIRKRDGLPPALLERAAQEQLSGLQLLYLQQALSRGELCKAHQGRSATAAPCNRTCTARPANSTDLSGGWSDPLLRGALALERSEHVRCNALQYRLSGGATR